MPRERSPNRDKAYAIYIEHGGNITNREIASILQEDEKVIAVWKSRDKWNVVQQSPESCTTKKKGGQPDNQNAKGHGAPKQNKNAVKTGEFETLFFDALEPEERLLAETIQLDKEQLLLQEIQLLTVRERRMLKRIANIKDTIDYADDGTVIENMTIVSIKAGIEKGQPTDLKEYQGKLGQIQAIEDALTRVQARKQSCIDSLHKYGYDDARLEIEAMKLELELMKRDGSGEGQEDDGFMDAMNATASEVWGNTDV